MEAWKPPFRSKGFALDEPEDAFDFLTVFWMLSNVTDPVIPELCEPIADVVVYCRGAKERPRDLTQRIAPNCRAREREKCFEHRIVSGDVSEHQGVDYPLTDWLFVGPRGKVMDYDWLRQRVFMPAAERLGLEGITIHSLRHTCASLLIKLKAPITTVSYILGHASVKMTLDTYGHNYEDDTALWINHLGDFVVGLGADWSL